MLLLQVPLAVLMSLPFFHNWTAASSGIASAGLQSTKVGTTSRHTAGIRNFDQPYHLTNRKQIEIPKPVWIGVLWAGLWVAMYITHVGGKFRHGLLEKSSSFCDENFLHKGPKRPRMCTPADDCARAAENDLKPPFKSSHLDFPNQALNLEVLEWDGVDVFVFFQNKS